MTPRKLAVRIALGRRREYREAIYPNPLTGERVWLPIVVCSWLRLHNPRGKADRAAFALLARDTVGKRQSLVKLAFRQHRDAGSVLWEPSREGEG